MGFWSRFPYEIARREHLRLMLFLKSNHDNKP
uniref:Uncharacterized protein n=1 Tax=Rhizophora mucronata TaxID=61149 RepID=A0A2P2PTV8_RHIMU